VFAVGRQTTAPESLSHAPARNTPSAATPAPRRRVCAPPTLPSQANSSPVFGSEPRVRGQRPGPIGSSGNGPVSGASVIRRSGPRNDPPNLAGPPFPDENLFADALAQPTQLEFGNRRPRPLRFFPPGLRPRLPRAFKANFFGCRRSCIQSGICSRKSCARAIRPAEENSRPPSIPCSPTKAAGRTGSPLRGGCRLRSPTRPSCFCDTDWFHRQSPAPIPESGAPPPPVSSTNDFPWPNLSPVEREVL